MLHKVSFRRSGVIRNEFHPQYCEQFGQCRLVVALGELLLPMIVEYPTPEQRSCSGLVFDIARKQYLPLNVFVLLGVLVRELFFRGAVTCVSECEQTWSLLECFAELLECAFVDSEGSGVPLVRLPIPRGPFVGCIGTFFVSVMSERA